MAKAAVNTADIRSINRKKIIQYIVQHPNSTRKQISDALALSFATVSNLSRQLIEQDILRCVSSEQSEGGRIPGIVTVNPRACCTLCIDLSSARRASVSIVNLYGKIIRQTYVRDVGSMDYDTLLTDCHHAAFSLLEAEKMPLEQLIGVGIAIPGIMDLQKDILVNSTYERLNGLPVRADFARLFAPLPCCACNEANLAVQAVYRYRCDAEKACQDIIYIHLDDGLGIGVISSGQMLVGSHGYGSEINHWQLSGMRGYPCYCGSSGCLETELSVKGFLRKYNELKPNSGSIGWNEFAAGVKAGEHEAVSVVRENGRLLARLIVHLQMLFDPEVCWLGGSVSELFPQLIPCIREYLDQNPVHVLPVYCIEDNTETLQRGCANLVFDVWQP